MYCSTKSNANVYNSNLNFNNHTTFLKKNDHVHLKINLKTFTNDLYDMMKINDRYCDNIRKTYVNFLNEIKQRLNKTFSRKTLYRNFIVFIVSAILRKIDKYYTRLFDVQINDVNLSNYTKIFKRIMNFFCAYNIESRLIDIVNEKMFKLNDVHFR